jgi:CHASE2 domain-containing sensor protein
MHNRLLLRPLLLGISLAAVVFALHHQRLLEGPEHASLDARFRWRGPLAPRLPIVFVSIDQDSFDELDLPWPWPRTLHAELVRKLSLHQARLIALDILFTEPKPDPTEDQELADAIRAAGNIILAAEYTEAEFVARAALSGPSLSSLRLSNLPANRRLDRANSAEADPSASAALPYQLSRPSPWLPGGAILQGLEG